MQQITCTCYSHRGRSYEYSSHTRCPVHPLCPYVHTYAIGGVWQLGDHVELGGVIKANGSVGFRVRCLGCGLESQDIGKSNLQKYLASGYQYTWTRTCYAHNDIHQCQVRGCSETDVEWHHFAPRNVFADHDNWPCLPLCRFHHQMWHKQMNGYQWNGARNV